MVEKSNAPWNQDPATGDGLHALLADAERRKETERKSKSHTLTLVLAIPSFAFLAWAAGFLLLYKPPHKPKEYQPVSAAQTAQELAERQDAAEFDSFKPKSQRRNPPKESDQPAKGSGNLVDKSDIEFAMQLLNFVQSPPKPKPPEKKDQ